MNISCIDDYNKCENDFYRCEEKKYDGASGQYFLGKVKKKNIFICLTGGTNDSACSDVEKAVFLSAWEIVLQYLEKVFGGELSVAPTSDVPKSSMLRMEFSNISNDSDVMSVFMPFSMVCNHVFSFSECLPSYNIRFGLVYSRVLLDTFTIVSRDQFLIDEGSVVFLPGSFGQHWSGRIYLDSMMMQDDPFSISCDLSIKNNIDITVKKSEDLPIGKSINAKYGNVIKIFIADAISLPKFFLPIFSNDFCFDSLTDYSGSPLGEFELDHSSKRVKLFIDDDFLCNGELLPLAHGLAVKVNNVVVGWAQ